MDRRYMAPELLEPEKRRELDEQETRLGYDFVAGRHRCRPHGRDLVGIPRDRNAGEQGSNERTRLGRTHGHEPELTPSAPLRRGFFCAVTNPRPALAT